jgi:hypothetical protein
MAKLRETVMAEPPVRDVVLFENGGNPFDPRMAAHPPIRDRARSSTFDGEADLKVRLKRVGLFKGSLLRWS